MNIEITKDLQAGVLTVVTEFDVPIESVWRLWSDPRRLERWWGPPGYPATVEEHELQPGGRVTYYMTSPEGDRYYGAWLVQSVTPPSRLHMTDVFADQDGTINPDLPQSDFVVELTEENGGTRMCAVSTYVSPEDLQQVLDMGVEEGLRQALAQTEAILAEG